MKYASFNIDVDPLICYYQIHGVTKKIDSDPLFHTAIPRFLKLLKEEDISATFFITADAIPENDYSIIKEISDAGHELANHSFKHDFRMSLLSFEDVYDDILENHQIIKDITGVEMTGFRAPGYNISENMFKALEKIGYQYDSSSFPSPFYYSAKWVIMLLMHLMGKPSRSMIKSFNAAFGSRDPYFKDSLLEFPITTQFYPIGLPFIGTSLIAFPSFLVKLMNRFAHVQNYINLELHAIDLADKNDSELFKPVATKQPDLKYSLSHKEKRIKETIQNLKQTFTFITLSELLELTH